MNKVKRMSMNNFSKLSNYLLLCEKTQKFLISWALVHWPAERETSVWRSGRVPWRPFPSLPFTVKGHVANIISLAQWSDTHLLTFWTHFQGKLKNPKGTREIAPLSKIFPMCHFKAVLNSHPISPPFTLSK